jgi:hypothetical protein
MLYGCKVSGFEVLTAVTIRSSLLSCNAAWFGKSPTFRMNISTPSSGSKTKTSRNQQEACGKQGWSWSPSLVVCFFWFLAWLTTRPWRWTRYVPPKRRTLTVLQPRRPYSSHAQRFCLHPSVTDLFIFKPLNLCEIWGSQSGDYEDYCLLGCDASIFRVAETSSTPKTNAEDFS